MTWSLFPPWVSLIAPPQCVSDSSVLSSLSPGLFGASGLCSPTSRPSHVWKTQVQSVFLLPRSFSGYFPSRFCDPIRAPRLVDEVAVTGLHPGSPRPTPLPLCQVVSAPPTSPPARELLETPGSHRFPLLCFILSMRPFSAGRSLWESWNTPRGRQPIPTVSFPNGEIPKDLCFG